jgi:hypothetical protein
MVRSIHVKHLYRLARWPEIPQLPVQDRTKWLPAFWQHHPKTSNGVARDSGKRYVPEVTFFGKSAKIK